MKLQYLDLDFNNHLQLEVHFSALLFGSLSNFNIRVLQPMSVPILLVPWLDYLIVTWWRNIAS